MRRRGSVGCLTFHGIFRRYHDYKDTAAVRQVWTVARKVFSLCAGKCKGRGSSGGRSLRDSRLLRIFVHFHHTIAL